MRSGFVLLGLALALAGNRTLMAESAQPFDLRDVKLLDSPFRQAMERNGAYLLSLEPDRFLHNFRKNAGLEPKAPLYGGWESPTTGAGRCLGHYLSALSLHYRSTGDGRFQQRIACIVDELALCQQRNGGGYLSAQEGLRERFDDLARGNPNALKKSRVPWYIQHKMFAGLRDAYRLAGNEKAKDVLLRLADWAVEVTKNLDDEQFQVMLQQEIGGIQEVLADAYAIGGNEKHLALARRFYHHKVQDPAARCEDKLQNAHANTQFPKFIGAARIHELTGDKPSRAMAEFFWQRVVRHHTYVTGGNSEREYFGPPDVLSTRLGPTTAESCNTYNMLKLTRHLIAWDPRVEYADFCERALYNHILASQDPTAGMFTYFLSLKPGHFRMYSTPHDSFWCCVGTGMENHTRYGESIYFRADGTLYVNLFIPSQLSWKDKGLVLRQETRYPESGDIRLTLNWAQPTDLAIKIRYPGWAPAGITVSINDQPTPVQAAPGGYVTLQRRWQDGDRIDLRLPLKLRLEATPDDPSKVAILWGPLVLGGRLGTEGLQPPIPYSNRQDDFAQVPDPDVPVLVTAGRPVETWIEPVPGEPLTFRTRGVGRPHDVTLIPFYRQYHERYTVYWDVLTESAWRQREAVYRAEQEQRRLFATRLVDEVHPGQQQSETDHNLQGEKTDSGTGTSGRKWRHAPGGWFSYDLRVAPDVPQELVCTYWGSDGGNRIFEIRIDGTLLATEKLTPEKPGQHIQKSYPIPAALTHGRQKVTVRFQAEPRNVAGGLFGCQILRTTPPNP